MGYLLYRKGWMDGKYVRGKERMTQIRKEITEEMAMMIIRDAEGCGRE